MSWVYQDSENYLVRNISMGLSMCNTNPLMLKELFQAFAWYIRNFYDELIFIIVVIICFHMETIVMDIFL